MRQYSLGVFILLLGCTTSQFLSKNQGYEKKTEKQDHKDYVNEDGSPVIVSDKYEPESNLPMDDVAYWESIYGTDDIPDFEVPPEINGETIFLDLADLAGQEVEETVQVKRNIDDAEAAQSSPSMRYGENAENFRHPRSSDYRNIMTSVYPSHFHEKNYPRDSETSTELEEEKDKQFYGSDGYSGTIISPNFDRREENMEKSGSDDKDQIETLRDINFEMESDSAEEFHTTLVPRSIKFGVAADTLIDSKLRVIQAKKSLVDSVAAGRGKVALIDAGQRKIEAKKELIDSLVSAKIGTIQGKKGSAHFFESDIDNSQSYSGNTKTHSGVKTHSRTRTQSSSKSIVQTSLDSKQEMDSIQESAARHTESNNAITRTLDAKRERIQSGISHEGEIIDEEREFGHGVKQLGRDNSFYADYQNHGSTAYNDHHGIDLIPTHLRQHSNPLQSVLDSKKKVIQAKKDLIHAIAAGGNKGELAYAIAEALDAKEDLIDSIISSKAEVAHNRKQSDHPACYASKTEAVAESEVQSPLSDDHYGERFPLYPTSQKFAKTSAHMQSDSMNSESKLESVQENSKVTKIQNIKSSLFSSVTGDGNATENEEIGVIDKLHASDHGVDISISKIKKVNTDSQISDDLESSSITHQSGEDSSVLAESGSSEIKFTKEAKTIHKKKNSLHSSSSESSRIVTEADVRAADTLSKNDHNEDVSSSVNKKVVITTKISSNSKSSLVSSQSGVDSSVNSDRVRVTKVKKEKIAIVEDSDALNVSSRKETESTSSSSESDDEDINESTAEIKTSLISSEKHIDTKLKDSSTHTECAPGKCGISGKLYIIQNSNDENENENLQDKLSSETLTESKLLENSDAHEDDEKIVKVESRPYITKVPQIVTTNSKQQLDFEKEVIHSDVNEDDEALEDSNEDNQEKSEHVEKQVIHDQQAKTVTAKKNIDDVSKSIIIETYHPKNFVTKIGKNEGSHRDELKKVNSHQEWHGTKKLSHFQNFDQFSQIHLNEVSQSSQAKLALIFNYSLITTVLLCSQNTDCFGRDRIYSKAECRLINLDVNCSSDTAFMNTECQQLNTHLWHPKG